MSLFERVIKKFESIPKGTFGTLTKTATFTGLPYAGHTSCVSANYATCHNGTTADWIHDDHISVGQTTDYKISRGYVVFDTSPIPSNASITAAVISLDVYTDLSTTDFDVTVRNGQPTYPHTPLITTDYLYSRYSGDGGSRNTSTLPAANNYWDLTLNSTGRGWITKGGITKLALISGEDINSSVPTTTEEVQFYDQTSLFPYLTVTYELNTTEPTSNVTLRELLLGDRDSWSGWHSKTWGSHTIKMIVIPKGSSQMINVAGVYPRLDALGLTQDLIKTGDQILTAEGAYYTVETIKPYCWGDSFGYYEVDLKKEALYQADAAVPTWSKTRPGDPRYRAKVFIDYYIRDSQITIDNDTTEAAWACIFNDPPYPLAMEFRGASSMNGLYVVDQPKTEALLNADKSARGYRESTPVHIVTVDSTNCSGSALNWKMEAELRYIVETYYLQGSLRLTQSRSKRDETLGGMMLYDTLYEMNYMREKT